MPGECITNALPIDNGISIVWAPDLWRMRECTAGAICRAGGGRGGHGGATNGGRG